MRRWQRVVLGVAAITIAVGCDHQADSDARASLWLVLAGIELQGSSLIEARVFYQNAIDLLRGIQPRASSSLATLEAELAELEARSTSSSLGSGSERRHD